jgi:hypothetical protein
LSPPPGELAVFGVETLGLQMELAHLGVISVRMFVAGILAAIIAFRPWRRLFGGAPIKTEQVHSQVLIAVAGALMVVVIGDSLGRAFGLVGLGAFIRFRSGIKDPRDAALMFVMIGIGMACGLGIVPLAVLSVIFVGLLLILFDATGGGRMRRLRIAIRAADPRLALPSIRAALAGGRVLEAPQAGGLDKSRILMEVDVEDTVDAADLLATLEAAGVQGLQSVALDEE